MLECELLEIMQTFAYALNMLDNKERAKKCLFEADVNRLKEEILNYKNQMTERKFFFEAGRAVENVLNTIENEDAETFNRMCGAIYLFEKHIGLEE